MTNIKTIEQLGYAGLVPFGFLAALMWLVDAELLPFVSIALVGYAATIVSFLGGVYWGIGFMHRGAAPRVYFLWGVAPSLLAWLGLLMSAQAALPFFALVLVTCYLVDRRLYAVANLSDWLPMRLRLTVVSSISCLMGAAAI